MNIYQYVANNNPHLVRAIIKKYGYGLSERPNLGLALEQLVAAEGEPVLVDIVENHPDKILFKDYFGRLSEEEQGAEKKIGCDGNCSGCGKMKQQEQSPAYMSFTGVPQAVADNKRVTTETSVILLASALLISFAIFMRPSK